jgi:hypothetical protein
MRSLDYARDDTLRDGALKNHCHSEQHGMRFADYARDDNLKDGALKNHCHSERYFVRSLGYARDDTLRDGALKKLLSFRTVFREESHPVKLRSTKRFFPMQPDEIPRLRSG